VVEVVDGRPVGEGVCLLLGHANDAQHLLGTVGVDPIDDAAIYLVPVSGTIDDRGGGRDECVEAKFAKGGVEEHPSVIVVGVGELQNDRNMRSNVDRLNGISSSCQHQARSVSSGAHRRRGRRGSGEEHKIVIHGSGSGRIEWRGEISLGH
jgi:hypothetical protein